MTDYAKLAEEFEHLTKFDYHDPKKVGAFALNAAPAILAAIRSHGALEAALEGIKRFGELACVSVEHGNLAFYTGGKKPASKDVFQFPRHMLTQIDAALALASVKQVDAAGTVGP